MTAQAVREFTFDPFSPAVMGDPLPFYKELRAHHTVYYNAEYDTWILSKFSDIYEMLSTGENYFIPSEGAHPPRPCCANTTTATCQSPR